MMIKVLLSGCCGRMGQAITIAAGLRENIVISEGFDINPGTATDYPVFSDINECNPRVDAVIDFSHPAAFGSVTAFCLKNRIPLVMATTGLSDDQISELEQMSEEIAVFRSSNMSIGVNLLIELSKKAAVFTEGLYDIEIVEKHHRNKIDAPSGTALSIADAVNESLESPKTPVYDRTNRREKRNSSEMGIHAVRGGSIVGEHSVIFAGNDEIIEIRHEALSRNIFAEGALEAALYISNFKTGLHSMSNMLDNK